MDCQHHHTSVTTSKRGIRVHCIDCHHTSVRGPYNGFEQAKLKYLTMRNNTVSFKYN